MTIPARGTALALYRSMARIRALQLAIERHYHEDEMKTPVHLAIGQEAIAAGVCLRLRREDYIASNHRGHGHYLAKGGDMKALVAELFCRATGCSRGFGGSMHLVAPEVGHMGSSSIVGGGIPIAVGHALAARMRGEERVSAAFFGDGAADEGVLYESVNFAMLRKLPVLFVCENNGWAVCSPVEARQSGELLFHSLPQSRLFHRRLDGNSAVEVHAAAGRALAHVRAGKGPAFLECLTYRLRGHSGAGSDAGLGYRTGAEIAEWEAKDPFPRLRRELLGAGRATEAEMDAIEGEAGREVEEAFRFARESPLPEPGHLADHLFRGEEA